ncbi:Protein of unknown function [Clostridium amylolyticum]|uniref:DUF4127 family protein n=1 Tax=Clostridium amylolyticum TaxID=1121298 RepID=A0A1M6LSN7_9CLOT|nr:DUF4127 family protein [Clostridium amylolyticum]SHJ74268.1 Protein of unknown function [Clostridium amylolyticum]
MYPLKLVYIPLDDRPVNTKDVEILADIAEVNLKIAPKEYLGKFMTKADRDNIYNWLSNEEGDVLVISLDMLLYGGLVASRNIDTSYEEAVQFMGKLKDYKEKTNIKIYAFSNIMRLSISVFGEESEKWWQQINKYNELRYRIDCLGQNQYKMELEKLIESLPEEVLQTYLSARERNHNINKMAIDFVKQDIIDFLILSQEDCSPYGLHLSEHEVLHKIINDKRLNSKINIFPGADEIGQVLLSKVVNDFNNIYPRVYIQYDDVSSKNVIPKFEDRPLDVNIQEHLKAIGAEITRNIRECDFILAVTTPNTPYIDMCGSDMKDYNKKSVIKSFVKTLKKYIEEGKIISIADIACANGGDPYLLEELKENGLLLDIAGYSAWNTAGNTIGTSIAIGSILNTVIKTKSTLKESKKKSLEFLIKRYADDYIYQSIVRNKTIKIIKEQGLNIFNMGKKYESIDEYVWEEMYQLLKDYFENHKFSYMGFSGFVEEIKLSANLPWYRVFEVDCDVTLKIN